MNFPRRALPALLSIGLTSGLLAADPAKPAAAATTASTVAGLAQLLKATGLTEPQVLNGVKSGLGTAVDLATTELAKPDAFQLSGPSSMAKLQSALVKANQTGLLDGFKTSLNSAATSVAPQATATVKEALSGFSLSSLGSGDASALASGAPDSATKMLRQYAEPALRAKLMPLVKQAIASNGTAAKVKEMTSKAGPFAAMLGAPGAADLENYLFTQVVDTSFTYIAKGEAAIRANPSMLKDSSAAKLFSAGKK